MILKDLFDQTPVANHNEIVTQGDRVYHNGKEYLVDQDGKLTLIRDWGKTDTNIVNIATKLNVLPAIAEVG